MIRVRRGPERGHLNHGWLDTWHTFSFGQYHDPEQMGFRSLRVINEDRVAPGQGFPTHPHRDMEILTWILEGALEHRDSLGHGGVIRPGEIQRMSAGTGVLHSEFNASKTDPVHLLQIWILPERRGITPGYEQVRFDEEDLRGRLREVAAPDGAGGAATIHQRARLLIGRFAAGEGATHEPPDGRHAWIQVARGAVLLGNERFEAGDGAAVSDERAIRLEAAEDAEVLVFDLG